MPVLFKVRARFDFKGEQARDLSFKKGVKIDVYGKTLTGWWLGRVLPNGEAGYFPSNYVKQIEDSSKHLDKSNKKWRSPNMSPSTSGKLKNFK